MQICLRDVNVAIDLPGLPQIPAPATDQSCAATSSANTLIGAGCPRPAPWCANLHSARRSPPHRLPFPAGSFIEGFRTPATVQAASLPSAGIRNPQQKQTYIEQAVKSEMCQKAAEGEDLLSEARRTFVALLFLRRSPRTTHAQGSSQGAHSAMSICPLDK